MPRQYRMAQIFVCLSKGRGRSDVAKAQMKLDGIERLFAREMLISKRYHAPEVMRRRAAARGGEIGWLTEVQTAARDPGASSRRLQKAASPSRCEWTTAGTSSSAWT